MKMWKTLLALAAAVLLGVLLVSCGNLFHSHSWEYGDGIDPTCEESGLTSGRYCSDCGEILEEQEEIPAYGHMIGIYSGVEPTCTSTGLSEGQFCMICNKVLVPQTIVEKTEHTYGWDNLCTECGHYRYEDCEHTDQGAYGGYEATCYRGGYTDEIYCLDCGATIVASEYIPMTDHTEVIDAAVAATCTKTGLTEGKHCSVCETVLVAQSVEPMIPHAYDDKYDAICNVCDYERDAECAHTNQETIKGKPASCTETGLTDGKKCLKCGELLVAQTVISVKPHTEVIDEAVEATCTKTGLTEGKHCSVCETVLIKQNVVPQADHSYNNRVCDVCGCVDYSKGLAYKANGDGTCYITGIGSCTDTEVYIPEYINGNKVTAIGARAFENCADIVSITIPDGVTSIGTYAFSDCVSLSSIVIPESVSHIGKLAFCHCRNTMKVFITNIGAWCNIDFEYDPLDEYLCIFDIELYLNGELVVDLVIPGYVTSIRDWAFGNCTSLKSVTINKGVTSIGDYAFAGCKSLESVDIYYDITSVGDYAFAGCTSLTSIRLPWLAENIGVGVLYGCTSLESIDIPFLGDTQDATTNAYLGYTFGVSGEYGYSAHPDYVPSSLKNVFINYGTSIGEGAFWYCTSLESIHIPFAAKSIGYKAFIGCASLKNVEIPDGMTTIGASAFEGCTSLESIDIPSSVTSIGYEAFKGCASLKNVEIPAFVTSMGSSAFEGCTSLESVTIPGNVNGLKSIASCVFYNCTSLKSITIPGNVTSIDERAFSGCTSLESITIPKSVKSIGQGAFSGCTSLESITIPFVGATKDGTSNTHFGYIFGASSYSSHDDYVPTSLKTVVITGGSSIGDYAFYNCTSLESIVIPKSVTSIGNRAFGLCQSLESIIVEDGNYAYHSAGNCLIKTKTKTLIAGCKNSVIPTDGSVTSIGSYAFEGCTSLTSIDIPDRVTSIGDYAFCGTSLESIVIPKSVTSVGDLAFYRCTSLESIIVEDGNSVYHSAGNCLIETATKTLISGCKNSVIPTDGSVTSIGDYAFRDCTSLTGITIPGNVTSIGYQAFYGCKSLEIVTIGNGVTRIGEGAFSFCTGLKSITIPDSVTSIGVRAFSSCTSLESITIPFVGATKDGTSNTRFGYIFGASGSSYNGDHVPSSLKTVVITGGSSIVKGAFSGCTSLESITIPDSVTSIGQGAFSGCTSLESITIPFVGASKDGTADTHFGYIFDASGYSYNTYVPSSLKTVVITGGSSIVKGAFSGCMSLESITIPFVGATKDGTSDTHFGYIFGASSYSDNGDYVSGSLKTVVITGGSSIGSYAFMNCTSLESITIPDSVTSIDPRAFYYCTSLTSITVDEGSPVYHSAGNCLIETATKTLIAGCKNSVIPADGSVTSIGDRAFYGCTSLASITIPDSVTSIGENAFWECTSLTSIEIPDSVTSIGEEAFSGCRSLNFNEYDNAYYLGNANNKYLVLVRAKDKSITSCTINASTKLIRQYAFEDCTNLESITIPDSVMSIGSSVFRGCTSLTSVTIPDSVTSIGENAFWECTSLTSVTIPDNVKIIDAWAFAYCESLTSIYIPDSVTSIGSHAFYDCTSLKSINFEGTMAQWNAISKGSYWNTWTGNYTVYCTDGQITRANS